MNEAFLHYIWQFQQFDKSNLKTSNGETITVLKPGLLNKDAGPDFSNARLLIGEIEWIGNVEIHLKTSDWNTHKHQYDKAYDNVILHIVWENDCIIKRENGSEIPTLALKQLTDKNLLEKYQTLLLDNKKDTIPCFSQFREVSSLSKISMFDKTSTQRLHTKALTVYELLQANNNDWEETAYQLLAKNFGFKINAASFLRLSQNLPLKISQKHRDNLTQIEALIFGQAGLLSAEINDEYSENLQKEYDFLANKYALKTSQLNAIEWKFLRLRPANFPSIRLAQFAKLIQQQASLFSLFTQTTSFKELIKILRVEQSSYWQEHYVFGKEVNQKVPFLGNSSAENIVINTVIPLLACYAQLTDNQSLMDRAISFLEQLPAEKNHITTLWESLDINIKTAFDSQASIELYNTYCSEKRCLSCTIGIEILKN